MTRKTHSIFTPVEEQRSILSQHIASFASDTPVKSEPPAARTASPPQRSRAGSHDKARTVSVSSIPETTFTPPSRANSFKSNTPTIGGARPRGPRLTVQIPDGESEEPSSAVETSISPRPNETAAAPQRHNSHSSVVLPPPSPSATTLLSAGATGPPNPFARPPPVNAVETPASALPSRFLGQEFLPSPSSFYNDWNFRASGDNTLPSPLNFTTPVAATGASFLRDEGTYASAGNSNAAAANGAAAVVKRKSPEFGDVEDGVKRVKVE